MVEMRPRNYSLSIALRMQLRVSCFIVDQIYMNSSLLLLVESMVVTPLVKDFSVNDRYAGGPQELYCYANYIIWQRADTPAATETAKGGCTGGMYLAANQESTRCGVRRMRASSKLGLLLFVEVCWLCLFTGHRSQLYVLLLVELLYC